MNWCSRVALATVARSSDRALRWTRRRKLDAPCARRAAARAIQLRRLTRIPASAAVNESVNLINQARLRSAAAFVNGVLRRATREAAYDPAEEIDGAIERIAVRTSHPPWLIEKWVAMLGAERAEALAAANNETPPAAFRVNELRAAPRDIIERLRRAGAHAEPTRVAPGGWRVKEGSGGAILRDLAGEGFIYLQDEASQLVAHASARGSASAFWMCAPRREVKPHTSPR